MRAGGWGPENPNTHLSTCNIFCVVQIKKCYSNEILLEYKPIFIKKACVICLHYAKYYTLIDEKLLCFILMNFKSKYLLVHDLFYKMHLFKLVHAHFMSHRDDFVLFFLPFFFNNHLKK